MSKSPALDAVRADLPVTEQVAFLNSTLESSTECSIVAEDLAWTVMAWNESACRDNRVGARAGAQWPVRGRRVCT